VTGSRLPAPGSRRNISRGRLVPGGMVRALAGLLLCLVAQPVLAQSPDWEVDEPRRRGESVRILVLNDYHLAAGDIARGPVIVIGGTATIDGHAEEDVIVLGGHVRVGPEAVVDGEVVSVGGRADVDPKARVIGGVDETVMRFPNVDGNWPHLPPGWLTTVALAGTMLRLILVLILASALTLIAPAWVRRISWRAGEGLASSAVIGLVCQIAFVPVLVLIIVFLAVSIIGIPLIGALPLLVAAAGVAGVAGFTAVAARIGARMRGTTVEASNALWIDVLIGMAVVSGLTVFTRFAAFGAGWATPMTWSVGAMGFLIEYVVWTIGIGAACATALARWKGPQTAQTRPAVV
jgi:hypothetical protein